MIAAVAAVACEGLVQGAPPKPNVLFILSDDQRFDTIHALGNAEIQTPNVDKLVERGFVFNNAYCQGGLSQAVCAPSRAMILTGRSVFHAPDWNQKPANPTLGQVMTEAGYDTLYAGKKSNSYIAGNEAFAKCVYTDDHVVENEKQDENSDAAQQPRLMADAATSFMHADHGGKPVFMFLAPHYPHEPRVAPKKFMD